MDPDPLKANQTAISGQMKAKWNALTDGDIEGIAGKKDQLVGKLQERYGYAKEQAEREADEFLHLHPEADMGVNQGRTQPTQSPTMLFPPRREEPALPTPMQVPPAVIQPQSPVRPMNQEVDAEPLPAGYMHSVTIRINPRLLQWIVPIEVVALFVLIFLPWVGAYPGGYPAYTQNAFQTIWGGVSVDPVAVESLGLPKPYDTVEKNPWMLFYTLFVLIAAILVVAPIFIVASRIQKYPPIVETLWRNRLKLLGASALAALVILVFQLSMGFGLEKAAEAKADQTLTNESAAAQTPEDHEKVNIHRAMELSPFNFRHTLWLDLAVLCHVLILLGVALEIWLEKRGSRPLPRIDARA